MVFVRDDGPLANEDGTIPTAEGEILPLGPTSNDGATERTN